MTQRIITALAYGISAAAAAITATGLPQTPEGWGSLAVTFGIAFWGKFSTNTRVFAPNRETWTDLQRKQEQLQDVNK